MGSKFIKGETEEQGSAIEAGDDISVETKRTYLSMQSSAPLYLWEYGSGVFIITEVEVREERRHKFATEDLIPFYIHIRHYLVPMFYCMSERSRLIAFLRPSRPALGRPSLALSHRSAS